MGYNNLVINFSISHIIVAIRLQIFAINSQINLASLNGYSKQILQQYSNLSHQI